MLSAPVSSELDSAVVVGVAVVVRSSLETSTSPLEVGPTFTEVDDEGGVLGGFAVELGSADELLPGPPMVSVGGATLEVDCVAVGLLVVRPSPTGAPPLPPSQATSPLAAINTKASLER